MCLGTRIAHRPTQSAWLAWLQADRNTQETLAQASANLLRRESKDATERYANRSERPRWWAVAAGESEWSDAQEPEPTTMPTTQ